MEQTKYNIYTVGECVLDELLGNYSFNKFDFCFVINKDQNENISIEDGYLLMKQWLQTEGFNIFTENTHEQIIRAKFPNNWKYLDDKPNSYFYNGKTAKFVLTKKEVSFDMPTRQHVYTIGSLEDELIRRDFTIYAMAKDLDGNLIDLFNGQIDLQNRMLKTPKEAKQTLLDNPLRILRAMRICITKHFKIHKDIIDAMLDDIILDNLYNVVSSEKIREELTIMFKHSTPRTLDLLNKINKYVPNFTNVIFKDGLWLKPTHEKT